MLTSIEPMLVPVAKANYHHEQHKISGQLEAGSDFVSVVWLMSHDFFSLRFTLL